MSPTDLDEWIKEQHKRVLFRYVLEDELIKELTEVVARGDVTCQAGGGENNNAEAAESENEKRSSQGSKEVELSTAQLGKSDDNTVIGTKLRSASGEPERGEANQFSINEKKSGKTRNNNPETVGNKSSDTTTDENIPSNSDRENNETYDLSRLNNPHQAEPDETSENTVPTSKRVNGAEPISGRKQKLTPDENENKIPSKNSGDEG